MRRPSFSRRAVAAALLAVGAVAAGPAVASSHREAPFITTHPQVDATDFYMFRSYEPGRDGYVTLIANYLPLQDPYGGPNYFTLDPDALYEIHVDNDGDAHRGPHVPVPLPAAAREHRAHGRRQAGRDPAGAATARAIVERAGVARAQRRARPTRSTSSAARVAPARGRPSTNAADRRHRVRQAGRLHRHEVDRRTTSPTRTAHVATSTIPGCASRRACSSASARTRSSSTWARPSTSSTSSTRRSS